MNVNTAIGAKVKQRRTETKMTLKQLGEQSGLTVGFLSQFERGLSSIALVSLVKISRVLEVPLSDLFEEHVRPASSDPVMHGIDLRYDSVSPQIFQSSLRAPGQEFQMLPRLFTLLPLSGEETAPEMYSHDGEEFVYVLEGVVTFFLEGKEYTLYAGDSIHIQSKKEHNWMNRTSRIAKILTVNMPNPLS